MTLPLVFQDGVMLGRAALTSQEDCAKYRRARGS